jgi:predicted NBD/HSP70 family sugar kinase
MLVAVDTGGTKTLVAGFYHDGSMADDAVKFPTPKDQNEYIDLLQRTINERFGNETIEAIIVALPGIIKDGVAVWCSNLGWKNFHAQETLTKIFKNIPVFIENDANLAGLAETRVISPLPVSSLYVTISTGIGTGIITNGQIDPGLQHSEGGHALVEFQGEMREWESFASGRAIYRDFGKFGSEITDPNVWQQIADRVSRGFLAVVPILQPDIIIIGGSMGEHFEKYSQQLETILQAKLPAHIPAPRFQEAQHPNHAVLYGCYYYALDQLAHS